MDVEVLGSPSSTGTKITNHYVWKIEENIELEELLRTVLLVNKNQAAIIETFSGNSNLFVTSTLRRIETNYNLTYPLDALTRFDELHDWMFKYLDIVQSFKQFISEPDWNCSYN